MRSKPDRVSLTTISYITERCQETEAAQLLDHASVIRQVETGPDSLMQLGKVY